MTYIRGFTVYTIEYKRDFVVLCFVVVISCDPGTFIWSVYLYRTEWNWLKLNHNKVHAFSSKSLGIATTTIMRWISDNYSISHKICTWFCCAFCCGYIMISWHTVVIHLPMFFRVVSQKVHMVCIFLGTLYTVATFMWLWYDYSPSDCYKSMHIMPQQSSCCVTCKSL